MRDVIAIASVIAGLLLLLKGISLDRAHVYVYRHGRRIRA